MNIKKEVIKSQLNLTLAIGVLPLLLTYWIEGKDAVLNAAKAARVSDVVAFYFTLIFLVYFCTATYWAKYGSYHFDNVDNWAKWIRFFQLVGSSLSGFYRVYSSFALVGTYLWWRHDPATLSLPIACLMVFTALFFFCGLLLIASFEDHAESRLTTTLPPKK